jgi:hypothetical protein
VRRQRAELWAKAGQVLDLYGGERDPWRNTRNADYSVMGRGNDSDSERLAVR